MDLHKVLKNSYASRKKQKKAFLKDGYRYDKFLSNDNEQVYYNPNNKKLLMSVAGTHNLSDFGTDIWLAGGLLKNTSRYKEAESTLKRAKQKYDVKNATISGHSLGGPISQYIASKGDQVYTLDKGATIGQKTRSNEKAYRTSGDLISILNANSTRMKTLKNPQIRTGNFNNILKDAYNAHNVDNIKNENIMI